MMDFGYWIEGLGEDSRAAKRRILLERDNVGNFEGNLVVGDSDHNPEGGSKPSEAI